MPVSPARTIKIRPGFLDRARNSGKEESPNRQLQFHRSPFFLGSAVFHSLCVKVPPHRRRVIFPVVEMLARSTTEVFNLRKELDAKIRTA